jgi:hypothetical protein
MDLELENRINETMAQLQLFSPEGLDFNTMDPIVKMMLVALLNEAQKIHDHIDTIDQRIIERYCTDFIPRNKVEAVPAIAMLNPAFRQNKDLEAITIGAGASFVYKTEDKKTALNYIPLFNTLAIPYDKLFILTHNKMSVADEHRTVKMGKPNQLWIGINTKVELECLQGLSLLIKGTNGICPEHVYVGANNKEIDFATMREIENTNMAEPFDAQQASEQHFSFVEIWKDSLLNMGDAALIVITDPIKDRDLFKPRPFPREFQQWLENEALDSFETSTLWIRIDFPEGFVIPDQREIVPNCFPVANIDICSLTLTNATPIAKLQKQDNAFFLRVLETSSLSQKQGFGVSADEITVRDFEADCYHNGDLYRDVRNLYNRFVDDYYAFIEYNNIKDGEVLKQLRETINKLGKSVGNQNAKFKFDSGTYAMKNMKHGQSSSTVKVNYITTQGEVGNSPLAGEMMENKKLPAIEQKIPVIVAATCGADKATVDERYEQLRYYALTNDRLYTKMDIDAFLRKEIMARFGKEEFKRIFIKMSIEGTAGETKLQRGLYIDIEFKDKKNYERAVSLAFDKQMRQKIENKSCIAMPIILELRNLEE